MGAAAGELRVAGERMTALQVLAAARALVVGNARYERQMVVRGRTVHLKNRGDGERMGRFGGGWQRQLGLQLGSRGWRGSIIINLWKGSVRIDPRRSAA